VEADMPNPPTGDEKFDQIRKDLKYCVKKAQGKITDNRVAEK
jgi:hypothetical protein